MRKSTTLLPLAVLMLAAFPAMAQEAPRVLFCMGQCFGVDEAGKRVPVTKGTRLAPGLRLETGPDSYAQVKIGPDTACAIGERSRVRFDQRVRDRDVVILDEGRIRMVGGDAIGRPSLRPVELHTTDGKFDLRSADIEVKTLPKTAEAPLAPTLVKLNIGEARLGGVLMTKDAVQGISGGAILERTIPIGDIALKTREVAPTKVGEATTPAVRESYVALPVANLQVTEFKPLAEPVKISTAIVSPELAKSSLYMETTALSKAEVATLLVKDPAQALQVKAAPVDSAMLVKAYLPLETSAGKTSLDQVSKQLTMVESAAKVGVSVPKVTITEVAKPTSSTLTQSAGTSLKQSQITTKTFIKF